MVAIVELIDSRSYMYQSAQRLIYSVIYMSDKQIQIPVLPHPIYVVQEVLAEKYLSSCSPGLRFAGIQASE